MLFFSRSRFFVSAHLLGRSRYDPSYPFPRGTSPFRTDAPYPATPRRALSLCLTQCAGLECPTDCPAFKPQRAHHSHLAHGVSHRWPPRAPQHAPVGAAGHHRAACLCPHQQLLAHSPNHFGYIEGGWTVDLLRDYLAQHQAPASDATVRRQLKAGDWVYKRFTKTVPRKAPSAEKKKPGWQRLSPPSVSAKRNGP